MPTYLHSCTDKDCAHEWEDFYSVSKDPPKICPKCNKETAERLICGTSRGVVELYGQDLVDKIKGDTQQLKKDMGKSEKTYSNMLGESRYESMQKQMDKAKKDRKNY